MQASILEAQQRSIPTLFALTRAVPFFRKLGFRITTKELFSAEGVAGLFCLPFARKL
ncbi:MAG: hypothetical protein M5U34_38950 [Chloroflexi bacterium]|nr:hypothetical protein [Chloroflexota bacterium]